MFRIKQILNQLRGSGPYRVASFAGIVRSRKNPEMGVHEPESFDGVLESVDAEAICYSESPSLLDQEGTCEMIKGRPRYLAHGIAPGTAKKLFSLSSAGALGIEGVVYCPRRRTAVEESLRCWTSSLFRHPCLATPRFPAATFLKGITLSMAVLGGEGFYHFLMESLPRLHLAGRYLSKIDHFLANGGPGSFQEKWLLRAGIPKEQIIWMEGLSHYRCEQLLFTNHVIGDYRPGPWAVQALRKLLQAEPGVRRGKRFIWISRTDAVSRQPRWESEILAELDGFESINLSKMEPAEQIEAMRNANIVAGPHGAGFSNILFCPPGTKVIEIFPNKKRQPIYGRLAQACGLRHAWAVVDFNKDVKVRQLAQAIRSFAAGS